MKVAAPRGVTRARILQLLERPLRMAEIADMLDVDLSTVTHHMTTLRLSGEVQRIPGTKTYQRIGTSHAQSKDRAAMLLEQDKADVLRVLRSARFPLMKRADVRARLCIASEARFAAAIDALVRAQHVCNVSAGTAESHFICVAERQAGHMHD